MLARPGFVAAFLVGVAVLSGTLTQAASSSTLIADSASVSQVIAGPVPQPRPVHSRAGLTRLGRTTKVAKKAPKKPTAKIGKQKAVPRGTVVVAGGQASAPPAIGSVAYRDLILSMIHFTWSALDFSITFTGPRPGYLGITSLGFSSAPHNRITIYVRPGESVDEVSYIAAYEIGHVVDATRNSDADRKAWLRLRGNPQAPWFTCNACTEEMVGAGDFSDVFAWSTTNHGYFVSKVAGPPTATDLSELTPYFLG